MEIIDSIKDLLNIAVFDLGKTRFTLLTIIYILVFLTLLIFVTAKLKKYIVNTLLAKSGIDIGIRESFGAIFRYIIIVIGFIIVFQTAGVDLSSLTILFGALGIGVGFGLQNVTSNFVSGLIILFERPIKIRDRIEVAGIHGDVVDISLRATTIVTNDNISVIVPNSEFISSTVINWSHMDRNVRFNIPVSVSYKEDPESVKEILLEVADRNEGILKHPSPDVLFDKYGDSSLDFNLRIWTRNYINKPGVLRSQLYYEIFKVFREKGVEIPYPQRDIHIKSQPVD
jgi:small-conductance mechanosensitive channel